MSKLLARARAALDGTKNYLNKAGEDDAYLDLASFSAQQSLEFALKALVELNGERYSKNHDIRAQLNILDRIGVDVPHSNELRDKSSTINSWETESRYKDNFLSTVAEVEMVCDIISDIIKFTSTYVISENKPIDAFSDE